LLYLAVLLRMKSDVMSGLDPLSAEAQFEDATLDDLHEVDPNTGLPLAPGTAMAQGAAGDAFKAALRRRFGSLDDVLHKRTSAKQPRQRPVTLADLLRELRYVEAQERERAAQVKVEAIDKRRRVRDMSHLTTEAITELAHDEFQEEMVCRIYDVLTQHLPPLPTEGSMRLGDVADISGEPWVVCYVALLFLASRALVTLSQAHFYSDDVIITWHQPRTHPICFLNE
jgi:chromatin segregation and condensation protein Rec8/ScpA/Scc1 (kleisin family)